MAMETVVLEGICGLAAGVFGAITGLGGGVILVPLLVSALHVPVLKAVSASMVAVIATSMGASVTYLRQGLTDVRLGMALELTTVAGAVGGAFLAGWVVSDLLELLFAVFLFYTAFSLFRSRREQDRKGEEGDYSPGHYHNLPAGLFFSGLAGVLSALLGIGGGIIKVPVMHRLMGLSFRRAVATSSFMIGITAAAGALVYWGRGQIDPLVAAPVAIGVYAGARSGAKLMPHLPVKFVRWLFAAVALYMALVMLRKGVSGLL
ncbi:MAG: uncharacterized protein PWQ31_170 [Eubacteriales bacterium]|nr:uncharacterized protein [Eubacteriales bacterium]